MAGNKSLSAAGKAKEDEFYSGSVLLANIAG